MQKGMQKAYSSIYISQTIVPSRKNYTAIPKPLYPEVKQYFEDLLNRGCVRKVPLSGLCAEIIHNPQCQHITAFVTSWVLHEWVRIPFGL